MTALLETRRNSARIASSNDVKDMISYLKTQGSSSRRKLINSWSRSSIDLAKCPKKEAAGSPTRGPYAPLNDSLEQGLPLSDSITSLESVDEFLESCDLQQHHEEEEHEADDDEQDCIEFEESTVYLHDKTGTPYHRGPQCQAKPNTPAWKRPRVELDGSERQQTRFIDEALGLPSAVTELAHRSFTRQRDIADLYYTKEEVKACMREWREEDADGRSSPTNIMSWSRLVNPKKKVNNGGKKLGRRSSLTKKVGKLF
jgi:hypothetical protein